MENVVVIIMMILACYGLYSIMDHFCDFNNFIKNLILSKRTIIRKEDGFYYKEKERDDGYILYRKDLTESQYIKELRKQKFKRICK
jgi:hypothetical protein